MSIKKISLVLATVSAAVLMPVSIAIAGYAPANRATFQCITPTNCPGANYVTFNSFTNAPNYGDERAFFDAKDAGITGPGGYQDSMTVRDGQKLVMRVYIHNNANPNSIGEAAATAHNTRMQVLLPTSQKTRNSAAAQITADNANPGTVSDTVDLHGANPFTIKFDRSAPVQVTYRVNGQGDFVTRTLPSASFASDSTLNANFGDWKGCFNYAALITFTAVVNMPTPTTPTTPTTPKTETPKVKSVTTLPNTGAGDVLGLFAGASGLGAAGHFVTRRFRR
jgi:LPXTG-motif cell wall-anchored protein